MSHPNLVPGPVRRHGQEGPPVWRVPPGPEAGQLGAAYFEHARACEQCSEHRNLASTSLGVAFLPHCGWTAYLDSAYVRTASRGEA